MANNKYKTLVSNTMLISLGITDGVFRFAVDHTE